MAAVLDEDELAHACHEAGVRHHTTPKHVEAILARRPNAESAAKVRAVLAAADAGRVAPAAQARAVGSVFSSVIPRPSSKSIVATGPLYLFFALTSHQMPTAPITAITISGE